MSGPTQLRRSWQTYSAWLALTLLGSGVVGCGADAASQLSGQWVGRPDSAAQRAARGQTVATTETTTAETLPTEAEQTDWEQHDAIVYLEFGQLGAVEMTMEGRDDVVAGSWKLIESVPGVLLIEIRTSDSHASDSHASGGDDVESVRRRFELLPQMNSDGVLEGFALSEVGVDRQLGALYFERKQP